MYICYISISLITFPRSKICLKDRDKICLKRNLLDSYISKQFKNGYLRKLTSCNSV